MDDTRTVAATRKSDPAHRGPAVSGPALAGAEPIIDRPSAEFPGYAGHDLRRLERAATLMTGDRRVAEPHYSEISRLAHDILGQGAVFGYPLLSRMAGSLCLALRTLGPQDEAILTIVRSHIAGMRTLIDQEITGTGNRSALTIAVALELMVKSRNRN